MKLDTIFETMPEGWQITPSTIHPNGLIWINNGKSRFSPEYRYALCKSDSLNYKTLYA